MALKKYKSFEELNRALQSEGAEDFVKEKSCKSNSKRQEVNLEDLKTKQQERVRDIHKRREKEKIDRERLAEEKRRELRRQDRLRQERSRERAKEREKRRLQERIKQNIERRKAQALLAAEIEDFLKRRKIHWLIHFTRIENIRSIVKRGLLPVCLLRARNIPYIRNDEYRFDSQLGCTSLSVEYPNFWVLSRFREKDPSARWAIIILDASLLKNYKCFFVEYNAATSEIARQMEEREGVQALKRMFHPSISITTMEKTFIYNRTEQNNMFDYLPTSDQAEILVEGTIQREYFNSIWFMSREDLEAHQNFLESEGIRFGVNWSAFNTPRGQYKGFKKR